MATADQILALVRSFVSEEDEQFLAVAMQVAAHEARQGHRDVARQLKELIEKAKARPANVSHARRPVPIVQPKGEADSRPAGGPPAVSRPDGRVSRDTAEGRP